MVAGVAAFCVVDGRTGRALYEADFGSTRRVRVLSFVPFLLCLCLLFVVPLCVCIFSPLGEMTNNTDDVYDTL